MTSAAPFISRTDLGLQLGKSLDDDEKALACVDAACDLVRSFTGQTINLVEDDEVVLDGSGTDTLLLPEAPVSEVSEVTILRYLDGAISEETPLVDYALRDGILVRTDAATFLRGRLRYAITYTHGYPDAELPRDLRMVALQAAVRLFTQANGAVFESLGRYQVRYDGPPLDFTRTEQAILRKYRLTK